MKGIQILGVAVGLYLLFNVFLNYKKKNYSKRRTIIMSMFWGIIVVLFLNPSLMIYTLPIFSTQDFIMTVLVISILFQFILINDIYNNIMENNKKTTELIQKLAIEDYYKKIIKGENNKIE